MFTSLQTHANMHPFVVRAIDERSLSLQFHSVALSLAELSAALSTDSATTSGLTLPLRAALFQQAGAFSGTMPKSMPTYIFLHILVSVCV